MSGQRRGRAGWWLVAATAAALALSAGGCTEEAYECGRGTFEERGVCVPAMRIEPRCGDGTTREGDQCVPAAIAPLRCGPGAVEIDEGDHVSCQCTLIPTVCPAKDER